MPLLETRADALDIEAFETMLASTAWASFQARVAVELERARATCENSLDAAAVTRAQGAAHALRMVLGLGPAMLKEMHAKPWAPSNKGHEP
jgi:hypothetical protein